MDSSSNDCYYFYNSTCTKGASCPFRHCEAALGSEVVCSLWKEGHCYRTACPYKHMEVIKNRSSIACFWESKPGGCKKPHCPFRHFMQQDYTNLSLEEIIQPVGLKSIIMPPPSKYHCTHLTSHLTSHQITKAKMESAKSDDMDIAFAVQTPTIDPVVVRPTDSEDETSSVEGSPILKPSPRTVHSPKKHPVRHAVSPTMKTDLQTSKEVKCIVNLEGLMSRGDLDASNNGSLQNMEEIKRKRALQSLRLRGKVVSPKLEEKNGAESKRRRVAKAVYKVQNRLSDRFKQTENNQQVNIKGESDIQKSQSLKKFKEQMKEKQLKKQQEIQKQLGTESAVDSLTIEMPKTIQNTTKKLSNKLTWRAKMKENQLRKQEEIQQLLLNEERKEEEIQQLLLNEERKEIQMVDKDEEIVKDKKRMVVGVKLSWREKQKQKQIALQEKIKKDLADSASNIDVVQIQTAVKRKLPLSNSQAPSVKIGRARPNPRPSVVRKPIPERIPVAGKSSQDKILPPCKPKSFVEIRKEKRLQELKQLKEQGLISEIDERNISGRTVLPKETENVTEINNSNEKSELDNLKIKTLEEIQIEKNIGKEEEESKKNEKDVTTTQESSTKQVTIVVPSSTEASSTRPRLKRKPAPSVDQSSTAAEKEMKMAPADSTTRPLCQSDVDQADTIQIEASQADTSQPDGGLVDASAGLADPGLANAGLADTSKPDEGQATAKESSDQQQETECQARLSHVQNEPATQESSQTTTGHEPSLQNPEVPKSPADTPTQPQVPTSTDEDLDNTATSDTFPSSTDGGSQVPAAKVKPSRRASVGRRNSGRKPSTDRYSFDQDDDEEMERLLESSALTDDDEEGDVGDDDLLDEIDALLND